LGPAVYERAVERADLGASPEADAVGARRREGTKRMVYRHTHLYQQAGTHIIHRPVSVHYFPRQALTFCTQICMGKTWRPLSRVER